MKTKIFRSKAGIVALLPENTPRNIVGLSMVYARQNQKPSFRRYTNSRNKCAWECEGLETARYYIDPLAQLRLSAIVGERVKGLTWTGKERLEYLRQIRTLRCK